MLPRSTGLEVTAGPPVHVQSEKQCWARYRHGIVNYPARPQSDYFSQAKSTSPKWGIELSRMSDCYPNWRITIRKKCLIHFGGVLTGLGTKYLIEVAQIVTLV